MSQIRFPIGNDLPLAFRLSAQQPDGTIVAVNAANIQGLSVKYGVSTIESARTLDYTLENDVVYVLIKQSTLLRRQSYNFFITGVYNDLQIAVSYQRLLTVVDYAVQSNYGEYIMDLSAVEVGGVFIGARNYSNSLQPYIDAANQALALAQAVVEAEHKEAEYAKAQGDAAKAIAQEVQQKLDDGEFKGEPGQPGAPGAPGEKGADGGILFPDISYNPANGILSVDGEGADRFSYNEASGVLSIIISH